jgi:hypothetical protein
VYGTGIWNSGGTSPPGSVFPPKLLPDIYMTQLSPKGLFPPGAGVSGAEVTEGYYSEKKLPNNTVYALFVNKDGQLSCEPCFGGPFKNQK